jgi:RNA polymerase sigma factor (TIGR02999 family)
MSLAPHEITRVLADVAGGKRHASDELLALVYAELRKLAAAKMRKEMPGQTLQPTALVHEAWLRLVGPEEGIEPEWKSRAHFFGAAAEAMRRILIDRARRRHAQRHGGGLDRVDVAQVEITAPANDEEVLAVNDALEKLALEDPQKAELVKLRYFVGLSIEETAQIMGISDRTARRHWTYAKAWLRLEIGRA